MTLLSLLIDAYLMWVFLFFEINENHYVTEGGSSLWLHIDIAWLIVMSSILTFILIQFILFFSSCSSTTISFSLKLWMIQIRSKMCQSLGPLQICSSLKKHKKLNKQTNKQKLSQTKYCYYVKLPCICSYAKWNNNKQICTLLRRRTCFLFFFILLNWLFIASNTTAPSEVKTEERWFRKNWGFAVCHKMTFHPKATTPPFVASSLVCVFVVSLVQTILRINKIQTGNSGPTPLVYFRRENRKAIL